MIVFPKEKRMDKLMENAWLDFAYGAHLVKGACGYYVNDMEGNLNWFPSIREAKKYIVGNYPSINVIVKSLEGGM